MQSGISGVCRDCGNMIPNARSCANCGSSRAVCHRELEDLVIAHVDCDAFFASIEKRDDPSLAAKPVIVGGGQRGVVATCCYIARTFGVRSAMPMFKAKALCPHAVIVKPRFDAYMEAASLIRTEMKLMTPLVQPISIDEAFLDLSGTTLLHGAPPAATLARLASAIEEKVGITVSVGLSHNKFLAKLASDMDKPRGFHVIGKEETLDVLAPLPTTAIFGVGKATSDKLARHGITDLRALQTAQPSDLVRHFGEYGLQLGRLARGEDARRVTPARDTKSISSETTFNDDTKDRSALEKHIYRLAQKVAKRTKSKKLAGRVVTLKLKTATFRSFTRRLTMPHPTNLATLIEETAQALLQKEEPRRTTKNAYRLIGVGLSDLVPAEMMTSDFLFAESHDRISRREDALDKIREKFGQGSIGTIRD